jgi:hypothetical protein
VRYETGFGKGGGGVGVGRVSQLGVGVGVGEGVGVGVGVANLTNRRESTLSLGCIAWMNTRHDLALALAPTLTLAPNTCMECGQHLKRGKSILGAMRQEWNDAYALYVIRLVCLR